MKMAVISLGGRSSKEVARECKNYFDKVDELDLRNFEVHLTNKGLSVKYKGKDLLDYDCLYIRGSFKYALLQRSLVRSLGSKCFIPMKPEAFTTGHDKVLTLLELLKKGISIPSTYCTMGKDYAEDIMKNHVGYPAIIRTPEGTHGKGVMMLDSAKSARTVLDMVEGLNKPFVIQEFVETKRTTDIRAIVVGHTVVASYKRKASKGDIRANVHLGGQRIPHKLTSEQETLAVLSARAVGAEICGVDILNSKKPAVLEINLSPALTGLRKVTKVNISKEIAKYLYKQTEEFSSLKKLEGVVNGEESIHSVK